MFGLPVHPQPPPLNFYGSFHIQPNGSRLYIYSPVGQSHIDAVHFRNKIIKNMGKLELEWDDRNEDTRKLKATKPKFKFFSFVFNSDAGGS